MFTPINLSVLFLHVKLLSRARVTDGDMVIGALVRACVSVFVTFNS